jgi:hypothetical protein
VLAFTFLIYFYLLITALDFHFMFSTLNNQLNAECEAFQSKGSASPDIIVMNAVAAMKSVLLSSYVAPSLMLVGEGSSCARVLVLSIIK